jgi:4-amino-4-deoxy-L-arabinose transferase-like glycosyltransferase
LIHWIESQPHAAFGAFLALHFAVWTTLPTLLYANLPLDLIEALTYGREWQLGYDKLPPLPWWMIEILYRLFGTDASYYALAEVTIIATFTLVWMVARPLVGSVGALIAVLIIDGMHYFSYTAVKFNHDVIQLPFWALAGYSFHAALKRERIGYWLLLGAAMGGALWAKYTSLVLVIPYALFLVFDRDACRARKKIGLWLALAVAVIIISPNLIWLFKTNFPPLAYGLARTTPARGWYDHLLHPAEFVAGQVFFLLPSFLIVAAVLWPHSSVNSRLQQNAVETFDHRIVTLLAFGPGLTVLTLTALSGRGTVAMWGYPLWLFLGLWLVIKARPTLDARCLKLAVATWGTVFATFTVAFVMHFGILPFIDHRYRAELYPGDQLALALTENFRAATGENLRYVIGSMWDGGNVAHYSPDQPRVLIDGLPRRAPWIDLNDLRAKGAVVIWTIGDLEHLPAQFAAIAGSAEVGTPFTLAPRRGNTFLYIGWAILKPLPMQL